VIRVEPDSVVLEGQWAPVDSVADTAGASGSVRVVCLRPQRVCREEPTASGTASAEPARAGMEYRVTDWSKATLVAVRRNGSTETRLRVSLIGLAAVKVVVSQGGPSPLEARWRLE
jgi:hypothetical protein